MSSAYETVKVEHENGIAWVILNRPDKRNAMSPQLHYDMCEVLDELEHDPQAKVLVLTGAGDAWCAGQDLKLFFRDLDNKPVERTRAAAASHYWRWQKLFTYAKPTIAMVNGFCFGGGFYPADRLRFCDRGGRCAIRPVGGQLGNPARRLRQQGAGRGARDAGCRVVRRDRRDLRRPRRRTRPA